MTDQELEALLLDMESDRVERKESVQERDRLRQVICAFANDLPNHGLPGILFVGVKDNGGSAGLLIDDELLLKLSSMRSEGKILPIPSLEVQKRRLKGFDVAVVIVSPALAPPVRVDGRVWVRVGPSRSLATPDQERRLSEKRRFHDLPADLQPLQGSTTEDLDLARFEDYLACAVDAQVRAENARTLQHRLQSLRFLTVEEPLTLTRLGVLICGKEPRDWVPGAYLQFVRFSGTGLDDPILDSKELTGPVPHILSQVKELLSLQISTALDLSGIREISHPDYPLEALYQLVINAVLHRTYEVSNSPVRLYWFSDRVEVQSPGGPFGQVNRHNFGQANVTDYRNPHLAEALKNLGYVQRFGVGIARAQAAMAKNGNAPIVFDVQDGAILATLARTT